MEQKKVKIGVLGAYRGSNIINYCKALDDVEIVAICDNSPDVIKRHKEQNKGCNITYYEEFEEFLTHDMDAVVLANFANEHVPFALKTFQAGKHVYSECLPVQTMKEAVELVEAVENSGLIYAYGENYCYMPIGREMKKLYQAGKIGEFEYGECEYIHNCEPIWGSITYGNKEHWRNNMYATFYCTHSIGPILYATGLRPVSVVGFEGKKNERGLRVGKKGGQFGIEMITLENGGIIKSIHGDLYKNSIWYCMYGEKGRVESAREDTDCKGVERVYVNLDEYSGESYGNAEKKAETYLPTDENSAFAEKFGHMGSDFYAFQNFIKKIRGEEDADIIDVYQALDMGLCGLLAYRSILNGNVPVVIPDFRDKAIREKYRNDTACVDPKVAGDQLVPTISTGTPEIADEVYKRMYEQWRADLQSTTGYANEAFTQSAVDKDEKEE